MAEITIEDRKFIVAAGVASDLQELLDELAQRRSVATPTQEGEPQQLPLVPVVVGGQEVYVGEASAPTLRQLVDDYLAENDNLRRNLWEAQEALSSRAPLPEAIAWMEAHGHFVRADPDGRVRVYNRERPGRSPRGQLLRSHAVAILPGPGEE